MERAGAEKVEGAAGASDSGRQKRLVSETAECLGLNGTMLFGKCGAI